MGAGMNPLRRIFSTFLIVCYLTGCAGVSPKTFYENPSEASEYEICKSLSEKYQDSYFAADLRRELDRRNFPEYQCADTIKKRNNAVAAALVIGLTAVAVAASARNGGGGGGEYASSSPVSQTDYDWEWDAFYGSNGMLVWACRGVQTGQLAEQYHCAYKVKSDWKWPGK